MTVAVMAWLIFAQTVRWSHGWITAISWLLFAVLVTRWALQVGWPVAIRAIVGSPLSPMVVAAALSAAINGGWWSRVADWALYAVLLAWLFDLRPDFDRAIVQVGYGIIGLTLFEMAYLALNGGGRAHLLGNSNVIAALLVLVVVVVGDKKTCSSTSAAWRIVTIALSVVAVWGTGSRAGLLGLTLYGLLSVARRCKIKPGWIAVPGLATTAVLMAARMVGTTDRIELYGQAIDLFVDHPLVGVGPGMYRGTIIRPLVMVQSWFYVPVFTLVHAHNVVLTLLAEMGLIGLITLVIVTKTRWSSMLEKLLLSPIIAVLPFYLVDDMTMYWAVSLGVLYISSREVRT